MTIGQRIKSKREFLGMSQEELALRLGYKSRSSINKIEIGTHNLTQSKIKAIADALDTTPDYIMGWTTEAKLKQETITGQLESIASEFCDKYCKYSSAPVPEGKTEDWLYEDEGSPCNNCPICRL